MLVCTYYQCHFCVKTSLDSVTSIFFFSFKKLLQPLISKMHVLRIVAEY
jgi:hypothetical protein